VNVRLLNRRRDLRQARQLARLLVALDDANRDVRRPVSPGRRSTRLSLSAR
jgi:hypothetical protein